MNQSSIPSLFPHLDAELLQQMTNRLDQFTQRLDDQKLDLGEVTQEIPSFDHHLIKALFFSEYIASNLIREPSLLTDLIAGGDLYNAYEADTYSKKLKTALGKMADPSQTKAVLLQTKLVETIRIAWRDLADLAPLEEILEDLSRLADAIVQAAVDYVYTEVCAVYGQPLDQNGNIQDLIVLGMGKLGARELNFSSDIDLIFVYPEEGYTNGDRSVSNGEFFTKVCRNFTKFFSAGSHQTNFYRVDTRLRPFGDGGPIVMNCLAFEEYYQAQGREWERYAMIKARPIAGDIDAGHRILKSLNSFIYRRYFDYGSFDSFRDMKQRISLQVKDKKLEHNIKLGAGGIREIEFFGQLFQLIRGGVEPDLQERRILKVLKLLVIHRCIDKKAQSELTNAYHFLRRVENRLQAYADLQTHDIPKKPQARMILALSMGYPSWQAFETDLKKETGRVHYHFNQLLVTEEDEDKDEVIEDLKEMWVNITDPQFKVSASEIGGFKDPEKVLDVLRSLKRHPNTQRLTANGRTKLNRLVPLLVKKISEQPYPDDILVKLVDLVITIERRTCYLSLLVENESALETLVLLAQKSPWIINFLSGHPALLDELMQPETLYSPPGKADLEKEMARRMAGLNTDDFEILLEELCIFRQINMLRVAAADISGNYPLMKVSDHLTYIAETVLQQVLTICWNLVTDKYGIPSGIKGNGIDQCGFAIVAFGKVGGFEMGYKSDIDIVFLHKGGDGMTAGPGRQVDSTTFYSNLGQRIIHALTMHTPAGTLYGADMRLRPGGASGMIVSHIDGYEDYMENEAWTWEHQALIRARPVAGDKDVCAAFEQTRKQILTRKRDPKTLQKDVGEMREKMREQRLKANPENLNLKQAKGGIVDIEFLVQNLILTHAHDYTDIVVWTDNIRLLESLDNQGLISPEESETLQKSYVRMRQAIHHLNLEETKLSLDEDRFNTCMAAVSDLYDKYLGYPSD